MDGNGKRLSEQPPLDPMLARRRQMVFEQIHARGIRNERVLRAMEEIPRERFLPPEQAKNAFADAAVPIDAGQTLSQPYMVAAMTAQLDPQPHERVLEIGTGSGYQTAILARLAREVYTIERIASLQDAARILLRELGMENVKYRVGDGTQGWPEEAPFDAIMVTAGAPELPEPLIAQLAEGGRMVIPVGGSEEQTLTTVVRRAGRTIETPGMACRFVKLIGRQGWPDPAEE
ncbi:MAG TPA: protein-L-isoaspartate(D-aspartate) O-methyltransferase [Phycisphaerae bacterium]|nr:protein-L-isoaspartate(D-aspartate) O-methyltransferase [Phycisphaerae bacterium]HPU24968.1 protein-L-isoaspartate(D-aspartate) O-methyltransferase [Phycisphaerae bacterium]